jgi:tape measure domain-containing protein
MATNNALRSELVIEANQALATIKGFVNSADNQLAGVGSNVGKGIEKSLQSNLSGVSGIIQSTIGNTLANVVTVGLSGIGGAISSQFSSSAGLETTRLGLNGLLGDAQKAGQVLDDVVKFAAATPFEIPELADTAKLLAGYGVSADNIVPSLKSLGDAAAGTGTPISQLARNFAQIQTQGKAGLIDLRQFAGAGVPIFGQLQKTLGKTKDEIEDLASSGGITSDIVTQAFKDMSAEGGTFFNAMKNTSNSVSGRLSTLSDTFGGLTRKVLGLSDSGDVLKGGLFDTASAGIVSLTNTLSLLDLTPLTTGINNIITAIPKISTWVTDNSQPLTAFGIILTALGIAMGVFYVQTNLVAITGGIYSAVVGVMTAVTSGLALAMAFLTSPITLIILAIGAVIAIGYLLITNWDFISAKAGEFGNYVIGEFNKLKDSAGNAFNGLIQGAKDKWNDLINFFKGINLSDIGSNIFKSVGDGFQSAAAAVGNVLKGALRSAARFALDGAGLGAVPVPFAQGGLVQGRNTLAVLNDGGGQEFVMNAEATRKYQPLLESLNRGGDSNSYDNSSSTKYYNYSTRVNALNPNLRFR